MTDRLERIPDAAAIYTEAYAAQLKRERDEAVLYAEGFETALRNLLAQVDKFVEQHGEGDFYTGEARAALAKNPSPSASDTGAKTASHAPADAPGPVGLGPRITGPGLIDGCPVCGYLRCECPSESVPVGVALGPRVIAPDAKIDLENATDADWADLTACLEREHVKKVIRETYALFDRFKAPFKQGAESAMDELSFRLLESWGEKNPHALADENNERPEPVQGEGLTLPEPTYQDCLDTYTLEDLATWLDRKYQRHGEHCDRLAAKAIRDFRAALAVPEGGARVPQDAFNNLSRLHGEARELARSYRDTACRTLDKAEIFARQGKPLPADEIAAMTARIVRDDKKLDGEGRPVKPHASGPAQVFPSPATGGSNGS